MNYENSWQQTQLHSSAFSGH